MGFETVIGPDLEVLLGEEAFRYDPGHYLISTIVLPVVSQIVEASEEKPYLGFQLYLDPALVAEVLMESGIETKKRVRALKR